MANEVRIKVIVDDDSAPGVAKAIAEQKALERETKQSQGGIRSAFMDTKQSLLGIALSLSPTILPAAAASAAGIGLITTAFGGAAIAAIGFGAMAKSVLASASSDSDKLLTINTAKQQKMAMLQAQLMDATTKKQKTALQTQIAAVTTASALQYNTVTAGWTKSYGSVVDSLTKIKASWKNTSRDIASPVLLPWLDAVDKGISFLRPLVQPVATEFQAWGKAVDQYFGSHKGSDEIKSMATSLGQFASLQLADIVQFIRDVGGGFLNLAKDTKGQGVYWGQLGDDLVKWGDAFNKWSQSKNARDDVHGFLKYLRDNGSQVMSFITQLAKLMPQLFQGASTIGTVELQALTAFLTFVNKLPKSWQAPIVELAGAMLILKKTGLVSVGVKLSKMAGLSGAGAAGGAAEGGLISGLLGGGLKWVVRGGIAFAVAEILVKPILQSTPQATGSQTGKDQLNQSSWTKSVNNFFGTTNVAGQIDKYFSHPVRAWFENSLPNFFEQGAHKVGPLWDTLWRNTGDRFENFRKNDNTQMGQFRGDIASHFDSIRHNVSNVWDNVWDNTAGRFENFRKNDQSVMEDWRHNIANRFDTIRHSTASTWDTIWNNTANRARSGVASVINWINNTPGEITRIFKGAGTLLTNSGSRIIQGLGSGIKSAWSAVANFFKGIPKAILNFLGIHSPPAWAIDAGKHIMNGLHIGMKAGGGTLGNFNGKSVLGALGGVGGAVGGGVNRWSGLVLQALKMLHLPSAYLHDVLVQMQSESGGNPNAINLTDSNALAGHPSKGLMQVILGTFNEWAGPFRSLGQFNPFANIYAALNYAKHGAGFGTGPFQIGSGHGYAAGGPAQGWIMAGEHGRELIRVPPSSHVFPHGQTEGMMTHGGSGGHMTIGLAPGTSDSKLMKEIIKQLRVVVFDAGGNVQDVLGWKS